MRRVGGVGLAAVAVSFGMGRQGYGLFVPVFREEFSLSLAAVGLLASAGYLGYLVSVLATGVLASRVGARLPVLVGCLTAATGAALVALAGSPALLAAGVVLAGASAGWTWAPFSDVVPRLVPPAGRDRALAWVNAGTPLGLVVASLLALLAAGTWRVAWALFAGLSVAAAVAVVRVLPPGRAGHPVGDPAPLHWRWFVSRRSRPLFLASFGLSCATSAYWTFVPDVVHRAGLPGWAGAALWTVLGVAGGSVGLLAGDLADRLGLPALMAGSLLSVAAATSLLALRPGAWPTAVLSAAVFGAALTVGFAVLVFWSSRVFPERPSAGFTATVLCSAAGSITGPALFGQLAERASTTTALHAAAVVALVSTAARPSRRTRSRPR